MFINFWLAFKILLTLTLVSFFVFCFITPIGTNLWYVTSAREYLIPQSSSIFKFEPTKMNQGSGEWWIYGEDSSFFYFHEGIAFDKHYADDCAGLDRHNVESWCLDGRIYFKDP